MKALTLYACLALLALVAVRCGAESYPMCPQGYYPSPPNVTFTRCLDAAKMSCCEDCRDLDFALKIVSANGTTVLNNISPGLGAILGGKDLQVCGLLAGFSQCALDLEQIICALGCNPDIGNYVKFSPRIRTIYLCSDYATKVYQECKELSLPGFGSISTFFPTKEQLFSVLVSAFANTKTFSDKGNYQAKIVEGTDKCYNGPKVVPSNTVCCDPLATPGVCLTSGAINTTKDPEFLPFINQTKLPTNCPSQAVAPSSSPSSSPPAPPGPSGSGGKGAAPGVARLAAVAVLVLLAIAAVVA